ncbi:MAG: glycosyltransferase [Elusimicrobiota bacterium]|nr:glycosyltransferase [Elusimicrobiota bacterium]
MKIAALVVWYNPYNVGVGAVANIETYSKYFESVIVVDNSKEDNRELLKAIGNAVYFPNYENVGIAKALNIGCQKALEEGYEWVLTMDQDSFWSNSKQLEHYIQFCEKLYLSNSKNISFAPRVVGLKEKIQEQEADKFSYIKIMLTSGNILNLKAWLDVGKFNEQLFIDDVDHEICYRLRQKGYNLISIRNCYMNHEIGFHGVHYGVRMYYITRNCLYMKKHWPEFWVEYEKNLYLRDLFIDKIKHLNIKDMYFMIKGYIHAKKGIYGKYK